MSKSLIWRWITIILIMVAWSISIPPVKDRDAMAVFKKLSAKKV